MERVFRIYLPGPQYFDIKVKTYGFIKKRIEVKPLVPFVKIIDLELEQDPISMG